MRGVENLKNIKTFLLDCDGVLWRCSNVLDEADKAVKKLRAHGCRVAFVTNNSGETRHELCEKLNRLGFDASTNECFNATFITAQYMKDIGFKKSAYIVGSKGLAHEFNMRGIKTVVTGPDDENFKNKSLVTLKEEVGAVVVGLDRNISYVKIAHAINYLSNESVHFIGTNPDLVLPAPNNTVLPCSGTLITAIQAASGRTPTMLGKPHKHMFDLIKNEFNFDLETTCMVGDRLETDILFGKNGGIKTALVFTGYTTKERYNTLKKEHEKGQGTGEGFCQPDSTFDSLKHLVETLFS